MKLKIKRPRVATVGNSQTNIGANYSDEQTEFLRAIDSWKRRWRRQPEAADVLAIAKALGYRRAKPSKKPGKKR